MVRGHFHQIYSCHLHNEFPRQECSPPPPLPLIKRQASCVNAVKDHPCPKTFSVRSLPSEPWPPEILGLSIKDTRDLLWGFFSEVFRSTPLPHQDCISGYHSAFPFPTLSSVPWEPWARSREWVSEGCVGSDFDICQFLKARWFERLVLKIHIYLTISLSCFLISETALSLRYWSCQLYQTEMP